MAKASTKLVFFGTEAWGVPSLEALVAANLPIAVVVTRPDAPAGRKRVLTPTPIKTAALAGGLEVWEPERLAEIVPKLKELEPSLGVLIAYGKIIPQAILDLFPLGIINFHPSALPKYRGPSPIETAILEGDELGHISFIELDAGMDSGDVVAKHQVSLKNTDKLTAPELYRLVGEAGAPLLVEAVTTVLDGTVKARPQDESKVTISRMITKLDGEIDTSKSALQLSREVRAFAGWPGTKMSLLNTLVTLNETHQAPTEMANLHAGQKAGSVLRTESSELALVTGDGLLIIDRLTPAGKREMTGHEFLAGHPIV